MPADVKLNAEGVPDPLGFFENVDRWGAAEWFNRLTLAIREQDKAVVAGDEIAVDSPVAVSSGYRIQPYNPNSYGHSPALALTAAFLSALIDQPEETP